MSLWTVARQKNGKVAITHFNSLNRRAFNCGEFEAQYEPKAMEWVVDNARHLDVINFFDRPYVVFADSRRIARA
jgi:hypothetical protein